MFLKALGLLALPALLVLQQPDLGTALVFGAVFFAVAFIGGAKLYQLAALAASGVAAFALAVKFRILEDYQIARLTAFLDPAGSTDVGYQVLQSKTAIGSGGLTGKGLEATTLAKLGFLPEDHTDFIFSNLAERLGFVGSALLLLLFFVLIWRMLHVATISKDRFGVLIAVGIATIFLFPRLRQRRYDYGDHAGHRHPAAVRQLRPQQPGGQRHRPWACCRASPCARSSKA
jgi:rod shape determining protein RodA